MSEKNYVPPPDDTTPRLAPVPQQQGGGLNYFPATLPSHGLWYGGRVPGGRVEVRKSTGREDIALDSANLPVMERVNRLIRACTRFPDASFGVNDLLYTDRMALALAIRSYTYGATFSFSYVCAACRRENPTTVDFTSGELTERTPDVIRAEYPDLALDEPFTLPLKDCGRTVGLRHLRVSDDADIERRVKTDALLKATQQAMGAVDLGSILQLSQRLVSVDGQQLPPSRRDEFWLDATGRDIRDAKRHLAKFDTGVLLAVTRTCGNAACGHEQKVGVPVTLQTFRSDSDSE